MEIVNLVGEYEVPETQQCSYSNHPHNHGVLVRSRCGLLLMLGMVCGRNTVEGFDLLQTELRITHEISTERELLQSEPPEIYKRLRPLAGEARRRLNGLEALAKHAPEVVAALRKAVHYNRRTVQVPRRDFDVKAMDTRDRYETREIKGLALFDGSRSARSLDNVLERACDYMQETGAMRATRENRGKLKAERVKWRGEEGKLKDWLDRAAAFWRRENLICALHKAFGDRLPDDPKVDGSTILIRATPRLAIGIQGVVKTQGPVRARNGRQLSS